jgi:hypothetical protein
MAPRVTRSSTRKTTGKATGEDTGTTTGNITENTTGKGKHRGTALDVVEWRKKNKIADPEIKFLLKPFKRWDHGFKGPRGRLLLAHRTYQGKAKRGIDIESRLWTALPKIRPVSLGDILSYIMF